MRIVRGVIVCILTICLISGIGLFLQSPPSALDSITGASENTSSGETSLEGEYILCFNKDSKSVYEKGFDHNGAIKYAATNPIDYSMTDAITATNIKIAVKAGDDAVLNYAENLKDKLLLMGEEVEVEEVDSVMLRAKLEAGKFDVCIFNKGFMDVEILKNVDFEILKAEEMRQAMSKTDITKDSLT